MKRSFKNLIMIIAILVTSFASNLKATPAEALGGMTPLPGMPGLPTPLGQSQLTQGFLRGMWGADSSHIFAVGSGNNGSGTPDKPVIYQTANGTNWTSYSPSLPADWGIGYLEAVWGADATHVVAVGRGGKGTTADLPLVSTWNGSTWTALSPALPTSSWTSGELWGVWGTVVGTTTHIYAVGNGGGTGNLTIIPMVYHWNGSLWSSQGLTLPDGYGHCYLKGIWGTSNTNIYAVGYGPDSHFNNMPILFHYDGTTWSAVTPTLTLPSGWKSFGRLDGIWGSSESDIYAVGAGTNSSSLTAPLIYHWDGSAWTGTGPDLPTAYWDNGYLYGVWGAGTDVYAVGHGSNNQLTSPLLYRKTSTGWAAASYLPSGWSSGFFQDMWGADASHVYAVGYGQDGNGNNNPLISYAQSDNVAPGAVTSLAAETGMTTGSIDLRWIAPADDRPNPPDPNKGPVNSYLITYSENPGDLTSCSSGNPLPNGNTPPTPVTPGQAQAMTVSGLTAGVIYYFSVCGEDEQGNPGDMAGLVSAVAQNAVIYDNRAVGWTYNGFSQQSATGSYGGTIHYTTTVGKYAQFTFTGAQLSLLYTGNTNRGKLDVFVDGTDAAHRVGTINQYTSVVTPQKKWTSKNLGPGTHTVRFVHAGASGKVVNIDALIAGLYTPPPGTGTYDDLVGGWTYNGSFSTQNAASAYDGGIHYSTTIGNYAEFRFSGSQVTLLYTANTNRGKVDVYLDDGATPLVQINQYSAILEYQKEWTSGYLGAGDHTLRFVHAGTSGKVVNVDALMVQTYVAPGNGTYDDLEDGWTYKGAFSVQSTSSAYGGGIHYSTTIGNSAEFIFNGTQVVLLYTANTNRGKVNVFLDDSTTPIATINQYSATIAYQKQWASPSLGAGLHKIKFVHAGASGKVINIDALTVRTYVPPGAGAYDDTHGMLTYGSGFSTQTVADAYGGSIHYSTTAGSYVEFSFTGNQFILVYTANTNRGQINVYLDDGGVPIETIDESNPTRLAQMKWVSSDLGGGPHKIKLEHAGGSVMDIDAIFVPVGTGMYDDTHALWSYSSGVSTQAVSDAHEGGIHYSATVGSTAEFAFIGSRFNLVYTGNTNRALVDVYVDGAYQTTIDESNPTRVAQMLWESDDFGAGVHIIQLQHASGSVMDIDAIQIP